MIYFYSLRSWLEVETDNFPDLIEIIQKFRDILSVNQE